MTDRDFEKILNRLKSGFLRHRFDEPGVAEEYTKKLGKLNYERLDQVIDELIEENSKEVPPISLLLKRYRGITKNNGRVEIRNPEYCPVCDDKGFIILQELVKTGEDSEGHAITSYYQFVYYCPYCAIGSQYSYEGNQCKEKSGYRVPAITEVLPEEGIYDIRRKNLKRKQQNEQKKDEIKARSLRDITLTVGKDVPEAKYFDEFIPGDAYEGDIDPDIGPEEEDMPF